MSETIDNWKEVQRLIIESFRQSAFSLGWLAMGNAIIAETYKGLARANMDAALELAKAFNIKVPENAAEAPL